MNSNRLRIRGIPYDSISEDDIFKKIENFFFDNREHTVLFLSLPLLMRARRNRALKLFLEEADLVIPTGKLIYWGLKFLNRDLQQKIDPSSLVKRIMIQSVSLNKRIYLFGGKGNVVNEAVHNLKKEIPKLFIVGKYRGNYDKKEKEKIIDAMRKASPDIFFISLGSPEEEFWIMQNRNKINSKVVILIEDLINVFGGNARRSYYIKSFDPEKIVLREIPTKHLFRRSLQVIPYIAGIIFERLFWKH